MATLTFLIAASLAAAVQTPAPADGRVEILSTAVVTEIEGADGRMWRPSKPDAFDALVIRVRVARGAGYDTTDLTLGYGAAQKQRAVCAGHTARIPDGWVINEAGTKWSFFPGGTGTLDGLGILFLVPKGVTEATLFYKGKPAGEAFPIKR